MANVPLIESVHFKNFKVLKDATLPLRPFTLIVGANGSGKSTALQALAAAAQPNNFPRQYILTVGVPHEATVIVSIKWAEPFQCFASRSTWDKDRVVGLGPKTTPTAQPNTEDPTRCARRIQGARVYALDAQVIAQKVQLQPRMILGPNGWGLAGVLDRLRDEQPERFDSLNEELGAWIPEFDRIVFHTPESGSRSLALRTRFGGHTIHSEDLSQGTLLALALLTFAYVPDVPPIIGLEEPDRGIHPRLLRDVKDALYRLSYPESYGQERDPVQVIATTHSPYMLDLFRDHPEEIVLAQKTDAGVTFERLSDRPDLDEILEDANLGDVWYSGILGGVPTHT
jgi:predicted ATPase